MNSTPGGEGSEQRDVEFVPLSPEQLSMEVARLSGIADDLTATLDIIIQRIGEQDDNDANRGPSRWSWQHSDRDTAAKLWTELCRFVDWLVARYSLQSKIMPCWYRHPVAVEELTALFAAWREAYYGSDRARSELIAWHDRWLWPCIDRVDKKANWGGCTRHHTDPVRPEWDSDNADREAWIEAAIQRRPVKERRR